MKILILTTFAEEAARLVEWIENLEPLILARHSCLYTVYHDNELYIANAGSGAIAAANTTKALCEVLHPDLIFISGMAMGLIPGQQRGDLIIGETIFDIDQDDFPDNADETLFSQWLLDPNSQTSLPYAFSIPAKWVNVGLQTKLPNVHKGAIASSNISPPPKNKMERLKKLQCDVIEMESAAVCRAAEDYAIPVIAIRVINHGVGTFDNPSRIEEDTLKICAERIAKLILACLTSTDELNKALAAE